MGISAPDLIFTPWYTLTAFTSSDIRIGMSAIFTGTVVNHSTRNDTNPSIIHGLSIGYNVFAVFSGFSSSIAPICQASFIDTSGYTGINECKWTAMNGRYFPSLYVRALSSNPSEYSFSGMYTPLISLPYVPPEGSTISSYITYPLGGNTVIYPTTSYTLMASTFQQMRIRILGQIQSDGWYQ